MLIPRVKEISIHGCTTRVYSLDKGRTWVSRPSDFKEFKSRLTHEKAICQKYFAERPMLFLPVSSFDADYWSR